MVTSCGRGAGGVEARPQVTHSCLLWPRHSLVLQFVKLVAKVHVSRALFCTWRATLSIGVVTSLLAATRQLRLQDDNTVWTCFAGKCTKHCAYK